MLCSTGKTFVKIAGPTMGKFRQANGNMTQRKKIFKLQTQVETTSIPSKKA